MQVFSRACIATWKLILSATHHSSRSEIIFRRLGLLSSCGGKPSLEDLNGLSPGRNIEPGNITKQVILMKCMSKLAGWAAALSLLLVGTSWAQINGGSIVGSVLDSSGAAIGGARVTATNQATNEALSTVTNET